MRLRLRAAWEVFKVLAELYPLYAWCCLGLGLVLALGMWDWRWMPLTLALGAFMVAVVTVMMCGVQFVDPDITEDEEDGDAQEPVGEGTRTEATDGPVGGAGPAVGADGDPRG